MNKHQVYKKLVCMLIQFTLILHTRVYIGTTPKIRKQHSVK